MVDALLLALFVAAPVAYLMLTRSTARMVLAVSFIVASIGGVLQLSTSQGVGWTLTMIQVVLGGSLILLVLIGIAERLRKRAALPRMRPQVVAIWLPTAAIALILAFMRLLAGDQPSVLSGVSFLINHPAAEDNAKWLNLTSQLAVGDTLNFSGGYAGGALIVVLAVVATAARTVSFFAYGGINEVGVSVQAVIGSSYLLIALAPLALAPIAERKLPPPPTALRRSRVPAPAIWAGAIVLAAGSAALTFFGHLSLQLVLLMMTVWVVAFLVKGPHPHGRLLASAVAVSAGVVWFPLNLLSLLILAALIVGVVVATVRSLSLRRRPDLPALLIVALAAVSAWDGLVSSTLYALGVGATSGPMSALGTMRSAAVPTETASLFASPGGTQVASSALVLLAAAAALGAGIFLGQSAASPRSMLIRFLPLAGVAGYAVLIGVGDGVLTASGENYPTQKMGYAASIVIAASCIPLAIAALSAGRRGMNAARWVAVGAVIFVLSADSLLPRAVATIGPRMWAQPAEGTPYWSTFEVQPTADQSIAELPIACAFLPPGAEVPNGKINGPVTYTCTRILIGLNGRDARDGSVLDWIRTDWLSDGEFWNDWAPLLAGSPPDILAKKVVLLDAKGNVIGFETLQGLLTRYPVPA
jgi:hypothetical protein